MSISKNEIISIIGKHLKECKFNNFARIGMPDEPMWEDFIVGFSRGDDPYYEFLKKDIGEFHWSPAEAFMLGKKGTTVKSSDLCLISIAFDQTQNTKAANVKEDTDPADRWIVTRGEWETMIEDISEKVVDELEKRGLRAVAVDHIKEFSRARSEKYGIASKWSHRHVAFISGLGTFGLSDGLITKKGKAMRFTTILVEADIPADVREYEKYNEWCLFMKDGSCGDCIKRCPVDAISKDGHDKEICLKYINHIRDRKIIEGLIKPDSFSSGCGFCQTGTACQDKAPVL